MNGALKFLISLLVATTASPAFAAAAYTAPSTISTVSGRDLGFEIYLPQADNPMGCSNAGTFRVAPSATNYNTIVSVLMSAQAQQKQVSVYAYSCDSDGTSLIVAARF